MKVYVTGRCGICGARIRKNGLSMVSHLRAHARNGELIERLNHWPIEFKSAKNTDEFAKSGLYF
jgi:hypothetical protein